MKSLTKKALSLAMAMAMAGSFAVSAATTLNITNADTDAETAGTQIAAPEAATVDVNFSTDLTGTEQLTVIIYQIEDADGNTVNNGEPGEANIGYINQFNATDKITATVEGTSTGTITFVMSDDFVTDGKIDAGVYKIMLGGTGLGADVARTATFEVTAGGEVYALGDINGSGGTPDVTDLGLLINHVLRRAVLAEGTPGYIAGDINKSGGTPDVTDLGMLINHVLRRTLITE